MWNQKNTTDILKKKIALIILHEIYGINQFIISYQKVFEEQEYNVFLPYMTEREYTYQESEKAYNYFMHNIGFDVYKEINSLIEEIAPLYDKVFLLGFSVGAAVAWRCSENALCDGVVCCYGSRIRDYLEVNPVCPTLLIFASEDSFDVGNVMRILEERERVSTIQYDAKHGFIDEFSPNYDSISARGASMKMLKFFKMIECSEDNRTKKCSEDDRTEK